MERTRQQALVTPSCILPQDATTGFGGLYHGGFKAAMNVDFLQKEGITHVVNTAAKGLQMIYGPKYTVSYSQHYLAE